jgi:hypothetical protein
MIILIDDKTFKVTTTRLLHVKYYYSREMNILIADRSLKSVLQVITGTNL